MIHKLAIVLTTKMDCKDNEEVFMYGLEVLLSSILNIALCMAVGFLTGRVDDILFFLLSFCTLRTYVGGYHANSHLQCCIIFLFSSALYLMLSNFKEVNILIFFISIIGSIDIIIGKPVIPTEYEVNSNKLTNMKKKSRILVCLIYILSLIYAVINKYSLFEGSWGYFALLFVEVFRLMGKIKYKEGENNV